MPSERATIAAWAVTPPCHIGRSEVGGDQDPARHELDPGGGCGRPSAKAAHIGRALGQRRIVEAGEHRCDLFRGGCQR
jgi:hypothetical protein